MAKQVMDIASSAGITSAQSDEHQRNWDEAQWERAAAEGNYDRSREGLNFEIQDGREQPIDRSENLPSRMARRLAQAGIQDPNLKPRKRRRKEGSKPRKFRTVVNFIFGGSSERMNEIAFGKETPDLTAGADNSRLRRSPAIVLWAKDVWNFVARLFGAENIIGFYVHLDETNPHAHCTLLPIRDGRFAFKEIFCGKTRWEMALKTAGLHDRLASEVGAKWGLERGNELLSLQEDIATAKSTLTHAAGTMGQKRKEITGLETDTASAKATLEDLERQKAKAEKGLSDTGKKLAEMSGTLYEAERTLGDIHALKSIILAFVEDFKKRLESLPEAVARLFSGTLLGRAVQDPARMTDNVLGLYNEGRKEGTQGLLENHGGIRCDDSLARESLAKALAEPQCDPRVMKLRR